MAILSVVAGVLALCVVVGVIGGLLKDRHEEESTVAAVPGYRITSQFNGEIRVEVDTMPIGDGLRVIFDDVHAQHDGPDGGYWVSINCSTGGTESADNRLANGKFGVGALGQAQTGLAKDETEFSLVEGGSCPAS